MKLTEAEKMRLLLLSLVIVGLAAFFVSGEEARYDNYRVYSIDVETKEQLKMLKEIEDQSDSVGLKLFPEKNRFIILSKFNFE